MQMKQKQKEFGRKPTCKYEGDEVRNKPTGNCGDVGIVSKKKIEDEGYRKMGLFV